MDTSFQKGIGSDEWYTPPEMLKALGEFDLDPAAPERPLWRTARVMMDKNIDGLSRQWGGRVWLNPPYSQPLRDKFIQRMVAHGNGILLIFARTGNASFQYLLQKADAVLFLRKRIKFYKQDGTRGDTAGCDSALFAFGSENVDALRKSGIEGTLMTIKR